MKQCNKSSYKRKSFSRLPLDGNQPKGKKQITKRQTHYCNRKQTDPFFPSAIGKAAAAAASTRPLTFFLGWRRCLKEHLYITT